jgi:hypothetical protein
MGTKKMKAIELVLDWNLWPRYEAESLDGTNIRGMREAIRAGVSLPPVIVNAADNRVIDGFHRVRAHLRELGDEATIRVDLRVYETEADMFLDAVKFNAHHGLPLSPRDRAHAIIKARQYKIPTSVQAMALGMTEADLKVFFEKRTAKTVDGERIPLSYGAKAFAGREDLTEEDAEFAKTNDGQVPIQHAHQLLNALRREAMPLTEKAVAVLRDMLHEIERVLEGLVHE